MAAEIMLDMYNVIFPSELNINFIGSVVIVKLFARHLLIYPQECIYAWFRSSIRKAPPPKSSVRDVWEVFRL